MVLERYETVLQGKAFGRIIDGIDDDGKQANGLGDHNSLVEGLGEEPATDTGATEALVNGKLTDPERRNGVTRETRTDVFRKGLGGNLGGADGEHQRLGLLRSSWAFCSADSRR